MFGFNTRKILLAAVMVLLIVVLCSCDQMTTAELPLEKRLRDDVKEYLDTMAGNKVLLSEFTVDGRDYRQADGTLDYDCTVNFAWDEFSEYSQNQIFAHYALADGAWALELMESDIDPAQLVKRVVMYSLFTDTADIPDIVKDALSGADTVLSQKLFDFTAELKGVAYQFPCDFTDFTMNGWEIAGETGMDALRTIAPQSYISLDMVNEDETVSFYIANQTPNTIYIGQGECIGVDVRAGLGGVTLPAGITELSTPDEVLAAYGDPFVDETTEDGRVLTYQAGTNSRVGFLFAGDGTQVDLFTLQMQSDLLPTAILFDTFSFGFSLDGVDYALPMRLDTLLDNGWAISGTEQPDEVIRWYEFKAFTLTKDESSVDVVVRNPSMGDLRLYAASVTGITLDTNRAAFMLVGEDDAGNRSELPMDLPAADILAALGDPSSIESTDGIQAATFAAGDGRYLLLTLGEGAAIAEMQASETDETASDMLEEFALTVNLSGNTFTLPAAAVEFKDKSWVPVSGWTQAVKAGSFARMLMENRRSEGLLAYFINTGTSPAALADCTVSGLYAGPDFANLIIGGSLETGNTVSDVFNTFGIPAYDLRDTDARYLVYGTSVNRFLCVRCAGDLVDALWIVCFTYQ